MSDADLTHIVLSPPMDYPDLVVEVDTLVGHGLDVRKAWTTVLFHATDTAANIGFKHKKYGYLKPRKGDETEFHAHVVSGTTLWFRGKSDESTTGPKDRAIAKEIGLRQAGSPTILDKLTHRSLIMAHDIASFNKKIEGGAKDFFLASPWQILNTLSKDGGGAEKAQKAIACQKNIRSQKSFNFFPEWEHDGQPMNPWPDCSMYNLRCDSAKNISDDKREYFFTIDLDGKHCCDETSLEAKECDAVIKAFERTVEGKPPILRIIGDTIKRAFIELGMAVHVSWHKSIGWKPSWRGYVVGAFFKNPNEAKRFVADYVMSKLASDQNDWYKEGLFDLSSYAIGLDRCIGSAKLLSKTPNEMRFLNTIPLEYVSDTYLVEMFYRCPNEYLLTVLGWIYPYYTTDRNPHLRIISVPYQSGQYKSVKRKRCEELSLSLPSDTGTVMTSTESTAIEELISTSLNESGFASGWTGGIAKRGSYKGVPFFEMNATGTSVFCVHNECEVQGYSDLAVPAMKASFTPHSSANKIKFRVSIKQEHQDSEKRVWLRQNCFKCDNKFKRVCPVNSKVAQRVMQNMLAAPISAAHTSLESKKVTIKHDETTCGLDKCIMNINIAHEGRVVSLSDFINNVHL